MRFTGKPAASPVSMTGSWLVDTRDPSNISYDPVLVELAGGGVEKLAPLQKFGTVMGVVQPSVAADLGFGQVVLPGVEDELREKGADELEQLIRREIGGTVKATSSVRTGSPHQEILREAEEQGVDLIVVATHGHSGVEHILLGSTADRIVRHAKCPVLTIRPQE